METLQTPALTVVVPHDERVSPNEIVEDEDQAVLRAISERTTAFSFLLGDMVGKYLARAERQGFRVRHVNGRDTFVTQAQVCEALGSFCKRSGRTMRYYYETARFYPQSVRDEFEMLDFSYFVVARSFRDRWREVLEFAAANPQADCETVRAVFLGKLEWSDAGPVIEEGDQPVDPERATDVVGALSRLLEAVSGFLKRVRLSPDMERRAASCLGEFRVLLIDIARELRENN